MKTQGRLPMLIGFFFHSPTLRVRISWSGRVRFAAMQIRVLSERYLSISPKSASLRYGVSMISWLWENFAETFSSSFRAAGLSSDLAGM